MSKKNKDEPIVLKINVENDKEFLYAVLKSDFINSLYLVAKNHDEILSKEDEHERISASFRKLYAVAYSINEIMKNIIDLKNRNLLERLINLPFLYNAKDIAEQTIAQSQMPCNREKYKLMIDMIPELEVTVKAYNAMMSEDQSIKH